MQALLQGLLRISQRFCTVVTFASTRLLKIAADPAHLVGARELELGGDDVPHLIDAVGDVVRDFQEDLHVSGLSFSLLHPVNLPFRHQWLIIMKSL